MARIVQLSHLPPTAIISAGQPFQLVVEVEQGGPAPSVSISLEKQRLTVADGGFLQLRPTGPEYFATDPKPIVLANDARFAISDPIVVRKDARDADTDKPLVYPDSLVFTAFIDSLSEPFIYHVVIVNGFTS